MIAIGSLILLLGVIALGLITKKNVGVIGFLAAYLYGTFVVGMGSSAIYVSGFPTAVFFLIMASTFMFGIANNNGTSAALAQNVSVLARGNNKIIPWLFFVVGGILSGVGGSMLILVVVMPIAYSVCLSRNLNVTMVAVIVMGGAMIGGLSPLALNGIVAGTLAAENGVTNYLPMWAAYSATVFLLSLGAYIVFGGWKIPDSQDAVTYTPFDKHQKITLCAIGVVCVSTVCFEQNVGLVCVAVAAVMILFNFCDQKKAIESIPWNTLVLIIGMSMLLNVVNTAGGITYLTDTLSAVLTPSTAQPILVILGGLLGAVSSGTGVAMPTLIPLATDLAANNSALEALPLVLGTVVGINGVVLSPFSTVGALACGCAPKDLDIDKLYRQLLIVAVIYIVGAAVLSYVGFYNLFV